MEVTENENEIELTSRVREKEIPILGSQLRREPKNPKVQKSKRSVITPAPSVITLLSGEDFLNPEMVMKFARQQLFSHPEAAAINVEPV